MPAHLMEKLLSPRVSLQAEGPSSPSLDSGSEGRLQAAGPANPQLQNHVEKGWEEPAPAPRPTRWRWVILSQAHRQQPLSCQVPAPGQVQEGARPHL